MKLPRRVSSAIRLAILVSATSGAVLAGGFLRAARAGTANYHVSLATTALTGGAYSGPFEMDFQFIDGGGSGIEPNNLAQISGFTYGGGTGPTSLVSLPDGIVPGPAEATIAFTPGSLLGFDVSITTNQDVGALPDSLSFAILDGDENPLPTTDPGGAFFYITESVNPVNPAPVVTTYTAPDGHGGSFGPNVSAQSAASAPEPTGLVYVVLPTVSIAAYRFLRLVRVSR